jgi:hypothetical protein
VVTRTVTLPSAIARPGLVTRSMLTSYPPAFDLVPLIAIARLSR